MLRIREQKKHIYLVIKQPVRVVFLFGKGDELMKSNTMETLNKLVLIRPGFQNISFLQTRLF
ncbi:hypothetical protein (plasmid) [Metabacillus dongyingensis]|nr:hypothetical protein [Metabacillus dongyingensis]